jgi:hypothetical protein
VAAPAWDDEFLEVDGNETGTAAAGPRRGNLCSDARTGGEFAAGTRDAAGFAATGWGDESLEGDTAGFAVADWGGEILGLDTAAFATVS